MTDEPRIVPVKAWLRPSVYRVLDKHAHSIGLPGVGELLTRIAEQHVQPTEPVKRRRARPAAELEARRAARAAAFAADPADPRHGTLNGYTNMQCRCDRCRGAMGVYNASKRGAR